MTTDNPKVVTVERVIKAPPQRIFDVLADPTKHPVIDGSGSLRRPVGRTERLELGASFGMAMRIHAPYQMRPKVVEFEEGRRIAWLSHFVVGPVAIPTGVIWRYELEPVDRGTLVRETWDWSRYIVPWLAHIVGFPEDTPGAMARTLERLDGLVTSGRAAPSP